MPNLTITSERVLEAASKCSQAKDTLKTLFPEVFEPEDDRIDMSHLPFPNSDETSKRNVVAGLCSEFGERRGGDPKAMFLGSTSGNVFFSVETDGFAYFLVARRKR
jgi:hypothetical protein